jgi:hypothetical protein
MSFPADEPVLILSVNASKSTPRERSSVVRCMRSPRLRPSRSSRQTTSTAFECADRFAAAQVPEPQRSVKGGRGGARDGMVAVRRHCYGIEPVRMAFERADPREDANHSAIYRAARGSPASGSNVELYLNRDWKESGALTEIPPLWFAGA